MNISSLSSSSGGSSTSVSSFDSPIHAPVPIVPLSTVHNNDNLLVNDIPFVLIEKEMDHLYNHYQIAQELFQVHGPNPCIRVDD